MAKSKQVTWTCGDCGKTISAPDNFSLGWKVDAHLNACPARK